MHILGLNYFFHDSSACLLRDGQLLVAIEEERLSHEKHTGAFPERAVQRCLEVAGLRASDVDHLAVSIDPSCFWTAKARYALAHAAQAGPFLKRELHSLIYRRAELQHWMDALWPAPGRRPRLHYVEHHLAHAAGSFLVSPYERAALLGLDGAGEWATSFLGLGEGRRVTCLQQSFFPHSLGSFYEAPTEFCGFRPNYDEGKTMGLAPYGDPLVFTPRVAEMVRIGDDGAIDVDLSWFGYQFHGEQRCGPKLIAAFGQPRRKGEELADRHRDVAAAFQRVLEERVLRLCELLHQRTQCKKLVIAGGVALNSVINGRIVRESPFEDLYVMPGAGDNGTCIGAAYYVYNVVLGHERTQVHDDPYVGTSYSDEQLRRTLQEAGLPLERHEDIAAVTAELLQRGRIVGWFQGRMEFGPRALGNRSILANPMLPEMKDVLNARVKHREPFRPFAPSAPVEVRGEYFEIEVEDPFMLKVCFVRPDKRALLPAITHVDGSARLQTVRRELNPLYHQLLHELGRRSGVPVVLNTSFNIMGQPIIESPVDALRCFFSTGLDELVLGNYVVRKPAA